MAEVWQQKWHETMQPAFQAFQANLQQLTQSHKQWREDVAARLTAYYITLDEHDQTLATVQSKLDNLEPTMKKRHNAIGSYGRHGQGHSGWHKSTLGEHDRLIAALRQGGVPGTENTTQINELGASLRK
jgi:hypothetical protein